jgi:hypothetical protein
VWRVIPDQRTEYVVTTVYSQAPSPTTATAATVPRVCAHLPVCPAADAPDREAAVPLATHPEQGWSLLCNGVVLFEDTGELLPDGRVIAPRRPTDKAAATIPTPIRG